MLHDLIGDGDRFAVVDVETTGLYNRDRIVEVAVVTVDGDGEIIDEWDTLVDPQRDVGPTHIHGVTASMVSVAPRFDEVAAALADRLYGAVLVAHNLTFDTRMLLNEFARLGARFVPGSGVCTLRLAGGKLEDICREYGVGLTHAHRALGDARATAQLLACVIDAELDPCSCARVFDVSAPYSARTLQRETVGAEEVPMPYLAHLASQMHHYGEHGAVLAYLDLLDRALADLVITERERSELKELAADVGLGAGEVAAAHRRYVDELVAAAVRDEVVTDAEYELLYRAAIALDVDPDVVDADTDAWRESSGRVLMAEGMTVCFTGSATYPDGTELPRSKLERIAVGFGLEPIGSVTKSGCDLLVAADTSSQSGKATKARKYGIPLIDVRDFVRAQPGSPVPAVTSSHPERSS